MNRNRFGDSDQPRTLLIGDVVRFMLQLSNLQRSPKTGNLQLAEALKQLAKALQRHSNRPISDLPGIFDSTAKEKRSRGVSQLPNDVANLSPDAIGHILKNPECTKSQLVELGVRRFGISRSKLNRLNKADAHESVSAALAHEKSLLIISEEAQRSGKERS